MTAFDEKDRHGDRLHQLEKAREDRCTLEKDLTPQVLVEQTVSFQRGGGANKQWKRCKSKMS
jgi:hypothetical protein